jgi:hypothetical protein
MIPEHEIIWAIEDAITSLPFKPKAKDLAAAIGWLLMHWGEKLVRNNIPELDPHNIEEVDKHYMLSPTYATAFILQGHLMRNVWSANIEKEGELHHAPSRFRRVGSIYPDKDPSTSSSKGST